MDSPKPAVNLETELTCSICADLLYQPLTLLDCLHTFCGACVKEWFSWQAIRAENAPTPPAPDVAVFTCPSCRDPVRDTKHDARVTTLLDMFLALNPDKAKSAADRDEMDLKYTKGEKVLPRLSFQDRTPEQKRMDAEERRLLEEVQQMSLREVIDQAAHASSRTRRRPGDGRSSRNPSRDPSRDNTRATGPRESNHPVDERRRARTSESRHQSEESSEASRRRVEHQSSLRSLINADGLDVRDLEREIEDFARQIQEEGLLDGLDLNNIDLDNNDELSRKITEAYRRRHRERARSDQHGGRRSNASSHSHQSDVSTRPRSRTGDAASRPTSRHSAHSRAPSASSNEERGRYPPSSSHHLDVHEPTRRRRTPSASRSATVPVGSIQPEVRVGVRSQTDLAVRSNVADQTLTRPGVGVGVGAGTRSSSSPTMVTASGAQESPVDLSAQRGLPFSARAAAGLGISQSQAELAVDTSMATRKRSSRPAELPLTSSASDFVSTSGPLSAGLSSPTLPSPSSQRSRLPRYREPFITCLGCAKEHIEYDLHYNCSTCHSGNYNICLDCYRRRKGCLNWFGFGHAAWARWEQRQAMDTEFKLAPPHILTAQRYTPPKAIPGGADGRRTLTTDNPRDRFQTGNFCSRCFAWANDCFWRCDACNEGDWGFCNDCVNTGRMCTHPLLPLSYTPPPPPPVDPHTPTEIASPGPSSRPATAVVQTRQKATQPPAGGVSCPLTITTPCEVCKTPIPPPEPRHHCIACPSKAVPDARPGTYNICQACYAGLVTNGTVAPENGPAGWRRCPLAGHRMVVVKFIPDERGGGGERRQILFDFVGGRRLQFEPCEANPRMQICSWREGGRRLERLVALQVGTRAAAGEEGRFTTKFPPDGGTGARGVAGWSWYPAAGVEDELMFPKGAEVVEIEDENGDWAHGFYMGGKGLFPAPYVRVL
ncbi:hypothetical protein B0T22DRAFT_291939 [Podospora appendiculata]|uniref:RING-type domain-containing protein n=1 Tax=Podospora appendiculata TaxID=314037 RepID=A0AAE1C8D3_9PEZI|nr:hypothetical protein B0T22DRAFT_291939 [Podospora appendiculata]